MTMSTREEMKLKESILTLMIECNTNDYYRDKANLIDKRTEIRDQMFKKDNEHEFDHEDYISFKGLLTRVASLELIIAKMLKENNNE